MDKMDKNRQATAGKNGREDVIKGVKSSPRKNYGPKFWLCPGPMKSLLRPFACSFNLLFLCGGLSKMFYSILKKSSTERFEIKFKYHVSKNKLNYKSKLRL